MKEEINVEHFNTLIFLVDFYKTGKKGCQTVETIYGKKSLFFLKKKDLAFHTKNGWFPSTKGQEYVREMKEKYPLQRYGRS